MAGTSELVIGALGIYMSFLCYGIFQENITKHQGPRGKFEAWIFLQAFEGVVNLAVGLGGINVSGGGTRGLPLHMFAMSGLTQLVAKVCTFMALSKDRLSFPVVTLAKSAKMAPVMVGSLVLGGERYILREYLQVAAIILGTLMVSMAGQGAGGGQSSTSEGLVYVTLSLAFDGLTGGIQSKVKARCKELRLPQMPYDFMFWTNFFIVGVAVPAAGCTGQIVSGVAYMAEDGYLVFQIIMLAACSAFGQSFIFYTLALFGPLKVTAVTTTRKILSVLLSVFINQHNVGIVGWLGILLGSAGIIGEMVPRKDDGAPPTRRAAAGQPLQTPQAPPPDDIELAELSARAKGEGEAGPSP